MKYAVIADIHGNLPALELALADAQACGAQQYIFLGDYCVCAPWPNEVIDRIRSLPGAQVIRGNEERYLDIPDGPDAQFAVSRWAGRQISADNKAWLDALPERIDLECGGVGIHMAHKSRTFLGDGEERHFSTATLPARYDRKPTREAFLEDVRSTLGQDEEVQEKVRLLPAGVYLFGHMHIQWHEWMDGRLLVAPGSCGLILDGTGFGAPYTLLTIENGRMAVEERRVPYDVEALIESAKATGQYRAARVWSEVIFEEWRMGWDRINPFLRFTEEYARSIGDVRRPFMNDTWEAAFMEWKKGQK